MKNLNWVEVQLRNLAPRQPSPKLKDRIFDTPGPVPESNPAVIFNFGDFARWCVPALGCFMLALASIGTPTPDHYLIRTTNDLLAESGKAQYSAYVASHAFHSPMNSVPVTRVESSLGSRQKAALPTLLPFTNSPISE